LVVKHGDTRGNAALHNDDVEEGLVLSQARSLFAKTKMWRMVTRLTYGDLRTSGGSSVAGKKILLDAPTDRPALGYEGIAAAFADIITNSQPNFAIGIFGGWGSGKTTLMSAIKAALPAEGILAVDFNAWRFEREPQLLVPLLDTIRGAIVDCALIEEHRAADRGESLDAPPRLLRIAGRVGRVVKALATGLSGSVGIQGAVTVNYDASSAIAALDA
jgi:hypothetical protein